MIYHIHPATPNIGNDLIVLATRTMIQEAAGRHMDIVGMPAKGVTAVIKKGGLVRETIYDINHFGAKVIVGPGNLFENNGLDFDAVAFEALQSPPLLFSMSAGRIYDGLGRLIERSDTMPAGSVRALCAKALGVLVRDLHTKEHLASLGIPDAVVIGCPVIALRPETMHLPPPDPRSEGAVLISLRNPQIMNVTPQLQGRVYFDLRQLIDGLRGQGHSKIALLCHDPRDIRFAAGYPDVPHLYTEDPLRYLAWLRDCRLNVTWRVHSLLPCAVLGTPSVHFTYDERARGLIETLHLQDCAVDYVSQADPVANALALCAEPGQLLESQVSARASWAPLRDAMMLHMKAWLAGGGAS